MKKLIVSNYQRAKKFYLRYERLLMPSTMIIGFLVDYFTFTSINIKITFIILSVYWVVAGATIIFINFYDEGKINKKLRYARLFSPLLLQFAFGALLGTSFVFYWLSGVFSVSWLIILIVALLMVFNDIFRHYFLKPVVQIGVYFFTTFSLFSLILPFLFNSLSPWVFVSSGVLSFIIFCFYIWFLPARSNLGESESLAKPQTKKQRHNFFILIFAIFVAMNFLYFANIIPPIPLFLREAGLYHSIKSTNGTYVMLREAESFWEKTVPGQDININPGGKVYLYTAIFAPAELDTTIVHNWQYYDDEKKDWTSTDKLSFVIFGGRKDGYKGYSFKSDPVPGEWRIDVENQRGQVLGRIRFKVGKTRKEIQLQEVIR